MSWPASSRFCAAAETVVTNADPAGLALFAALSSEPLADDVPARAMQLVMVLRELRGSVHLLAVVSAGVSPRVAHYFRRPNDFTTFGYAEDDVPTLTRRRPGEHGVGGRPHRRDNGPDVPAAGGAGPGRSGRRCPPDGRGRGLIASIPAVRRRNRPRGLR